MEGIDLFGGIIEYVKGFFDWVYYFATQGIVDLLKDAIAWIVVQGTVLYFQLKLFALDVAWGVASQIINQFQIGYVVSSYVSQLSPTVAYVCSQLGVFDGLNLILQSAISSYVMRLFGV